MYKKRRKVCPGRVNSKCKDPEAENSWPDGGKTRISAAAQLRKLRSQEGPAWTAERGGAAFFQRPDEVIHMKCRAPLASRGYHFCVQVQGA